MPVEATDEGSSEIESLSSPPAAGALQPRFAQNYIHEIV